MEVQGHVWVWYVQPMATYLKSTHNKQSINVVLSHLSSNFANMFGRKRPEEMKGGEIVEKHFSFFKFLFSILTFAWSLGNSKFLLIHILPFGSQ